MSRRSRGRTPVEETPLRSLTQTRTATLATCSTCTSTRVTRITIRLTDGTPVDFTSCHACETKVWLTDGSPIEVSDVMRRSAKHA